jgi:hypothetical protein
MTFELIHKERNVLVVGNILTSIIFLYFKPDYKEENIDQISTALNKIYRNESLILMGDLNCRIDKSIRN